MRFRTKFGMTNNKNLMATNNFQQQIIQGIPSELPPKKTFPNGRQPRSQTKGYPFKRRKKIGRSQRPSVFPQGMAC